MSKNYINQDLTPKTADSFLLTWKEDIKLNLLKDNDNENLYLGNPKNLDEGYVGIYTKKKLLEIDWTLKPENAKNRGYEWISDCIYDAEAPEEMMRDIFEMKHEGYLFGEPANINTIRNGFVGVYKPIKD